MFWENLFEIIDSIFFWTKKTEKPTIDINEKSAIKITFLLYFLIIVLITEDLYLQKNKKMPIKILGIESSCDETSAAVISDSTVLSNIITNQDVINEINYLVSLNNNLNSLEKQKLNQIAIRAD